MLITIIKFSICKRFRLRLLLFAQKSEYGALAQLGAHHTGSVGVTGSNPVCSTKIFAGRTHDARIYVFAQGFGLSIKLDVCC